MSILQDKIRKWAHDGIELPFGGTDENGDYFETTKVKILDTTSLEDESFVRGIIQKLFLEDLLETEEGAKEIIPLVKSLIKEEAVALGIIEEES